VDAKGKVLDSQYRLVPRASVIASRTPRSEEQVPPRDPWAANRQWGWGWDWAHKRDGRGWQRTDQNDFWRERRWP